MPHDGPQFPGASETEVIRIPWDHRNNLRQLLFQTIQLGRDYCRDAVLLTTDSKFPFVLPKSCIAALMITDLAVYRMPEVYQFSGVLRWRLQYRYVKRRADFFLTISEFTKREMTEILQIPPEKIHVVPCACSTQMKRVDDAQRLLELRKKYSLPERFVLFFGNSNPRKNLRRIIQAFDLAKK